MGTYVSARDLAEVLEAITNSIQLAMETARGRVVVEGMSPIEGLEFWLDEALGHIDEAVKFCD